MRSKYPHCILLGNDSEEFYELCRSLRFSTHCRYVVLSLKCPFDMSNFEYMDWISILETNLSDVIFDEDSLFISCYDGEIDFKDINCSDDLTRSIKYFRDLVIRYDEKISEDKRTDAADFRQKIIKYESKLSEILLGNNFTEVSLDFIIDFEGDLKFLGAISKDISYGSKLMESDLFKKISNLELVDEKDLLPKNNIITMDYVRDDLGEYFVRNINFNQINSYWLLYRAVGINIPLILVQNLLQRKVKTYYFVDQKYIKYDKLSHLPYFNFAFKNFYFDLDETLICLGNPIKDLVELLIRVYEKKKVCLRLITRHKFSINDSLKQIGLSQDFFEEIIPVLPHQKKSSFIKSNSIFIDNEFPERLDIHLNCKIPSLDLDQIDFLKIR